MPDSPDDTVMIGRKAYRKVYVSPETGRRCHLCCACAADFATASASRTIEKRGRRINLCHALYNLRGCRDGDSGWYWKRVYPAKGGGRA